MKRALFIALTFVATANTALGSPTGAHSRTSSLTVKSSVIVTCTVTTPSFNFSIGVGAIHAPGTSITKQSSLALKCTKNSTANIAMDNGLYGSKAGAQFGSRSMKSSAGNDYLGYDLCHDSACSSAWTPQGYNYISPTDQGSALSVWTRIKTGQPQVKQGLHTDAVTVTVSF